jgi:pantetheine-phosphate adenylyltransferase
LIVVFGCFIMVRVAVGGTFEFLHLGHRRLLAQACELAGSGGEVVVGVTSDSFALLKGRCVEDFDVRCGRVWDFVSGFDVHVSLMRLDDAFGPALEGDFDYIVVSPGTFSTVVALNKLRCEKGLPVIEVVCVDYVLAEDGLPISSSRVARGEIDIDGRLIYHDNL